MIKEKVCIVCNEPAKDGIDDQVAVWGLGIHHADSNKLKVCVSPEKESDMEIFHRHCFFQYLELEYLELGTDN